MVAAPPNKAPINFNLLAKKTILELKDGNMPDAINETTDFSMDGDFGIWGPTIERIKDKWFKYNGKPEAMARVVEVYSDGDPDLKKLLTPKSPLQGVAEQEGPICPPLPKHLEYPPELAASACKWLDDYIAFSKKWSPRGYADYHECVGVAVLSTVAAGRVTVNFGGVERTPFFMSLVGFTTFFRKTTTAKLYYGLLKAAGLDWLLGANIVTPQKLLSNMAGKHLPANFEEMDDDQKKRECKRLAMSAQRGWYYDEFGLQLDQMVQEKGVMADFKGLLRKIFDGENFEYDTIKRSLENIEKPYLSLLVGMTVEDIRPYAQKGNKFWKDGLWPRFLFTCPPRGAKSKRDRFPDGKLVYPYELTIPLVDWHQWLRETPYELDDSERNKDGKVIKYIFKRGELPETDSDLPPKIKDALYDYEDALLDMCECEGSKVPKDLWGCYGRLHMHALHICMLLAAIDNRGIMEMRHWARAQQFIENRRKDLHEMYAQTNVDEEESEEAALEEEIIRHLKRYAEHGDPWATANKLRGNMRSKSREEIEDKLKVLEKLKILEKEVTTQAVKYKYIGESDEDE